ncbi:penicillin-binding transpeptidase domain-containing protein [Corynebacterium epidermidicanis]|uniref:Cell division protein FtsI/penicillin-binding protein 2 n=1 Tax=Corynebacterium epidermidicanis TaxID=1050174 RepID=A0A0G3GL18_9CORY|nr:penicillin-binding protein 2 [Corynebacterium epidermidicanis]AKK01936.1 cell division protein FtsI/penicillin-binding protein 2 [Corynebacterium epidermidicanis]
MNKSIRKTFIFALLLILALLINLTRVQAFSDDEYAHNALNRRGFLEMKSQPRGQISAGGQVLAQSVQDSEGFYQRSYPNPVTAYGPVIGYLSDIYGASGLEASKNEILNGSDPSLFASRWLDQLTGKEQTGASIKLTLQPEVQRAAYEGLTKNGYSGAVVAIRPKTGEVLAMASTPSYDPAGIVGPDADSVWQQLNSDPDSPMLNHATQETLPPGSTFKVITTAAALQKGYNLNSPVTGAREITLPNTNTTLENYGGQSCGGAQTTLQQAFAKSCNTAFVEMGIDVGDKALTDAATKFGVGEKYDLGLPVASGSLGDLSDPAARGQSSIGQRDVSMSVLQNAVVAATVANGGKRMEPHLVSEIQGADLKTIRKINAKEMNQAVDKDTAAALTELMRGSEKMTVGYRGDDIASKTGTAEHGEDSRNSNPHAWYIAFGPSKDADVAVAVVVKNGGDRGQAATGGSVAAPIGRAVIDAALRSAR